MKTIVHSRCGVEEQESRTPTAVTSTVLIRVAAVGLNPVDAKRVMGDKLPKALKSAYH